MKNSFYLVIPKQLKNAELLLTYEKAAVTQWILQLPTANPGLTTRLFYDYIDELNKLEIPVQQRLDILEILRPHFISIKTNLRSRLIRTGFPKTENELKIFDLLVALEKNITISYWIVARELTRRSIKWLQGKNSTLAIQRTMTGLGGIIVTHHLMFSPVPDWVWIDVHSLYKLSVNIKKETIKISDETSLSGKSISIEESYKKIVLLSLAEPSGLMQKEMEEVYQFIENISQFVKVEQQPVKEMDVQCIIPIDDDKKPYFAKTGNQGDNSVNYLDLNKLHKAFEQKKKFCSENEVRFSSMQISNNATGSVSEGLFQYISQRWRGIELKGTPFFKDRLDRHVSIGLGATHTLQETLDINASENLEVLAESYSETELSHNFKKEGVLSIGSLVSFRKKNESKSKRYLGMVTNMTHADKKGRITFELSSLAANSVSVGFSDMGQDPKEQKKGLLYSLKDGKSEKSYLLVDSFMLKDGDVIRLYMNETDFPAILGGRENIGLGYWQFECRRIEEKQVQQQEEKKGYDFI